MTFGFLFPVAGSDLQVPSPNIDEMQVDSPVAMRNSVRRLFGKIKRRQL
jgi:hypothetical protein